MIKKIEIPKESKTEKILSTGLTVSKNLLDQAIENISSTYPNIPKDGVSVIKVVLGTSLDILYSIYASEKAQERANILFQQLNDNFTYLDNFKIDKEQFEIFFRKALKSSIESVRKEKIELFANALTEFSKVESENDCLYSIKVGIINDIDAIEYDHVLILKVLLQSKIDTVASVKRGVLIDNDWVYTKKICDKLKINNTDCYKLLIDLESKGLIIDRRTQNYFNRAGFSDYGLTFIKTILFIDKLKID